MIYDFIAIDFETASNRYNSACSLGLAFVKNSKIVDQKYYLIKPPGKFVSYNVKIHGLTEKDVEHAPTWGDIWPEINTLTKNSLLVAHSASFDISVLIACCNHYNFPLPHFQYIDSIDLFRAAYPTHQKASLDYCAHLLSIKLDNHHNAMEDAIACAQVAIKSIKRIQKFSLPQMIAAFKSIPVKTSNIIFTLPNLDTEHPLYGQELTFDGDIISVKGSTKILYQTVADSPLPPANPRKKKEKSDKGKET
ncbi:MAG: 3'-5' exonuclease [Defluviitaleaceae bacterium]|nr:3'-5' exonuclease [Defluviitaleaceae bacterium]